MAFDPNTPLTHEQAHALEEALEEAFDTALDAGRNNLARRAHEASLWLSNMQRYTTEDSRILLDTSTFVTLYDCYIDVDKVLAQTP